MTGNRAVVGLPATPERFERLPCAGPVAVVDPQPECKPVFKAEKIEPDQVRPFPLSTLTRTETLSSADTVLFAHAITRLGNQGWQIIGEGAAYCHTDSRRALHLKRALY